MTMNAYYLQRDKYDGYFLAFPNLMYVLTKTRFHYPIAAQRFSKLKYEI